MNTWADRIKSRMKELELTQEELAGKLGITRGAITHYLAGRRVPPLRQFQKLASVLKSDPAWLQFGTTSGDIKQDKPNKSEAHDKKLSTIPIVSWEQAANLSDVRKLVKTSKLEFVKDIHTIHPHWYALRVKGDSMTAPSGNKSFHAGDIILVDPEATPKHGDFVIAVLPKSKEATFKQFVIDGGKKYLKPLNTQYPLTVISKTNCICGVVNHKLVVL